MAHTFDESILSDLHKDARGYRPREGFWHHWNESTMDEKQAIWDGLCRELDEEIDRERAEQDAAVAAFEQRVNENIKLGAADRITAIRWLLESLKLSDSDLRYGGSYVCFELGLPYGMQTLFDPICKSMLQRIAA